MESKRIGPRPGWDYYPIIIAKQLRGTIDKKSRKPIYANKFGKGSYLIVTRAGYGSRHA